MGNAICTLARISPDSVLPELVRHSEQVLENGALMTVTHTDCAIMNTPEGELWDKSVLDR